MDVENSALMEETIPRLAVAMQSALTDAQIQVLGSQQIDIRFDGLPAWKISVMRKLVNNQHQMVETQIDLLPLCLASMSTVELQRLAALENVGLRGVSVVPIQPDPEDERGGLRIRAAFVGQKGRTTDEVENLATDILTVLTFARTLEDRVTQNSIAGEFSFELYGSRYDNSTNQESIRFIKTGQKIFEGSEDRVFSQIIKAMASEFSFEVRNAGERSAIIRAPNSSLEIVVKIPKDTQLFVAHASLMKLENMSPERIWLLLDELNSQGEAGHFEVSHVDGNLCFTAWKHLTNDLRHFSFDHTIFSVHRAYNLATESIFGAPVFAASQVINMPNRRPLTLKKAA